MADWFYVKNGEQKGPVSKEFLQGLVQSGQFQRTDLVWTEGMKDWAPAQAAGELGLAPSVLPQAGAAPDAPVPPEINFQGAVAAPALKPAGLAIASLVLGILGILLCGCCGPFSLLAVIFGHVAWAQVNRQPAVFSGKGMAIAGLILGYLGLIAFIIFAVLGIFGAIMEELSKQMN
jgi:hypothetical protein